jgi:hypothetical protein
MKSGFARGPLGCVDKFDGLADGGGTRWLPGSSLSGHDAEGDVASSPHRHSRVRETSAKEVCRLIFDDGVNLEAGSG